MSNDKYYQELLNLKEKMLDQEISNKDIKKMSNIYLSLSEKLKTLINKYSVEQTKLTEESDKDIKNDLLIIMWLLVLLWLITSLNSLYIYKTNGKNIKQLDDEIKNYESWKNSSLNLDKEYIELYNSIKQLLEQAENETKISQQAQQSSQKAKEEVEDIMKNMNKTLEIFNSVLSWWKESNTHLWNGLIESSNWFEQVNNLINSIVDGIKWIVNSTNDMTKIMSLLIDTIKTTEDNVKILEWDISNIENVFEKVKDISESTNLLSLNAAIEASRAWEYGRWFAVVAEEVRKLSDETQEVVREAFENVKNIKSTNEDMTKSFEDVVKNINYIQSELNKTSNELTKITEDLSNLTKLSEKEKTRLLKLSFALDHINDKLWFYENILLDKNNTFTDHSSCRLWEFIKENKNLFDNNFMRNHEEYHKYLQTSNKENIKQIEDTSTYVINELLR